MKRLEIALIVLGILITALMASTAALACMEHEEWPQPSEDPPVETLGQEGDYCEFQDGECAAGLECTGLPCMTKPCDPDDEYCDGEETLCPMGGICTAPFVEVSCETDADCADGQACTTYETTCPTFLCDPDDDDCDTTEPVDCKSGVFGVCEAVSKNPGQCSTDADCGSEAFECGFTEVCECLGGIMGDDGGTDPSEEDNCPCTTLDEGHCQLIESTCDTDADCTGAYEGFACTASPATGVCFVDLETGEETCTDEKSSKVCMPSASDWPQGVNFPDNKNTGNNAQEAVSDAASGGCHIGSGGAAGGAVLPMLVLLVGWITRRRLATTH